MEFAIGIDLPTFLAYYPTVDATSTTGGTPPKVTWTVTLSDPGGSLGTELNAWASELKNMNPNFTTCCIQMSHAINMSFHIADHTKMVGLNSYWRPNRKVNIGAVASKEFYYLRSVDEMKAFLDTTFGGGEEISRRGDGKVATVAEAQAAVQGRPGIVCFMNNKPAGYHTEVWTGSDWHQSLFKGRTELFGWRQVWFWDMGVARNDDLPMV
jgi:Type VI secretion system (T6SS), amidase effector protein 4